MEIKKTVTQEFQDKISLLRVRFLIATDEYRNQLKQQYLEEKQEEYNTFNQDRDEEFIEENKVEFDDFCTKEYEED